MLKSWLKKDCINISQEPRQVKDKVETEETQLN